MNFLSFLPETYLLILLFCTLIFLNFRFLTHRSLSVFIAGFTSVGLIYFLFRQDLAYFTSPLQVLLSDSLSYFGKILSLLTLIVFSMGFHFHRKLNFYSKQSSNLFLLFYSLFMIGLFQSNNLIFFLGSALGIYLSSMNLILIESGRDESWVSLFRQKMLPLGLWALVVSLLFVLGTHLFGSVYISDWVAAFAKGTPNEISYFIFAFLVLMSSAIPLGGLGYYGKSPLGVSILCYSLFLVLGAFWLRLGIPFFSLSHFLSKELSQALLSLVFGGFTIRYAWQALRTREHHRWFASALPTAVGLSLFLILLSNEQALPAFFCLSVSLLFTFGFVSHSFLEDQYEYKGFLLMSLAALVGAPPLILGEQFYKLVHDAVNSGNWIAGILMMISWFGLTGAAIQMMAKVLLNRIPPGARRKIYSSEYFFLGLYLICVITLTAFRPGFVALLNEHPILNLW